MQLLATKAAILVSSERLLNSGGYSRYFLAETTMSYHSRETGLQFSTVHQDAIFRDVFFSHCLMLSWSPESLGGTLSLYQSEEGSCGLERVAKVSLLSFPLSCAEVQVSMNSRL